VDALARALFDLSPAGVILFRPVYSRQQELVDFAYNLLNATAQQLLQLPAQPTQTFRQLYPHTEHTGIFAFYRDTFLSGQPGYYSGEYRYDGLDAYYQLAARRADDQLVVTFTDEAGHPQGDIAAALQLSYQREQQARAEAERQRRELQRILEQAPVAIAVYRGPQFVIELANPLVCQLWGRQPEQLVGVPLFEALPEVAGMGYEERLAQVLATGEPYVAHASPAQHDRQGRRDTVYWDFVYVPMHESSGSISGVMVVATEVTEQVLARQRMQQLHEELEARVQARTRQLTEQQALLSRILGQVPAAIATLSGPAHHYSFANARYQQLVSQRVELGKTVLELLPELAEQGVIDLLDHVYTSGEPYVGTEIAMMLVSAGGEPLQHYFDFVYQPLVNGQGQTQGILVFALDVTEQVRTRRQASTMQAALLAVAQRQARERLELLRIFEHAPVAVALLREPGHRIDYFNELFEALFPGAQLGLTVAEAYSDMVSAATIARLDHVYETGETHQGAEVRMPGSSPEAPRYVTLTYQAYREQDRIVGVAVFVYEVTDQVVASQQVQDLNAELTASNRQLTRTNAELDSFVYTASHDLKAPIANLEGLLAALRQDLPAAPPVAHLLGLMEASVGRFQQTIGHLAEVASLSPGDEMPTELVDLAFLIEDVRLDLATELTEANAQLSVEVGACLPVQLAPQHLRSIVYNLLSNALRYRAPGRIPEVRLQATCSASQLVLIVQDNGLGLDAEQQSKLFRLFKRLHSHVQGSGVGLYAVKKVVENAGGTITVQSEAAVGSTFTVSLPLRPSPGASQ
jgi:PAS domain S-box-containing protein